MTGIRPVASNFGARASPCSTLFLDSRVANWRASGDIVIGAFVEKRAGSIASFEEKQSVKLMCIAFATVTSALLHWAAASPILDFFTNHGFQIRRRPLPPAARMRARPAGSCVSDHRAGRGGFGRIRDEDAQSGF